MKPSERDDRVCRNCKWRSDEFTSACVNGDSPNRGDFVMADDTCHEFERDEEDANHSQ